MGASGTTTLNFGAFPGTHDTSVAITGQAGILAGSLVEAWLRPVATADHSADEHRVEALAVMASDIVAGTGFTIYGQENGLGAHTADQTTAHLLYGLYTVAWVWN